MKKLLLLLSTLLTINAGLDFDSDDVVTAASTGSTTFDDQTALTYSMWVKPGTLGGGVGGTFIIKNTLTFRIVAADGALLFTHPCSGTDLLRQSTASAIATGSWQHVAVTADGTLTGTGVHIYVNGTEVSYATTTTGTGAFDTDATAALFFSSAGSARYVGVMSSVAIWNVALSAAEVAQIASSRIKYSLPQWGSLLGYWPLDDVAEGAAADTATMRDRVGANHADPNDGTNNTGMLGRAEEYLSYP